MNANFLAARMPDAAVNPPDTPADDDPIGHHAWANEQGISPPTALMLCATTLAHFASPTLYWDQGPDLAGARPPCLLGAESDVLLRRALDRLVSNPRAIQQRLVQASQEFAVAEVDREFLRLCERGIHLRELAKFNSSPGEGVDHVSGVDGEFSNMLDLGNRTIHREKLLTPVFMVDSLPQGPLAPLLLGCNHGACCLTGGIENLPPDTARRHQRLDELIRYIDGAIIEARQPSTIRTKLVSLRGIFLFRQEDIHWLMEERRDFMRRLIPVSSNPAAPDSEIQIDPRKVHQFLKHFNKTALHVLATRRAFAANDAEFRSPEARQDFVIRRRLLWLRSANDPTDLTALPDLLMWFLLKLAPRVEEQTLVNLAMDATETLRHEACRTFVLHDNMEVGLKRHENARKMLRRIAERGPLKRHELVRIFDQQKLAVHAPVIDALIARGFLREDQDKRLHIGSTPLSRLSIEHLLDDPNSNAR